MWLRHEQAQHRRTLSGHLSSLKKSSSSVVAGSRSRFRSRISAWHSVCRSSASSTWLHDVMAGTTARRRACGGSGCR